MFESFFVVSVLNVCTSSQAIAFSTTLGLPRPPLTFFSVFNSTANQHETPTLRNNMLPNGSIRRDVWRACTVYPSRFFYPCVLFVFAVSLRQLLLRAVSGLGLPLFLLFLLHFFPLVCLVCGAIPFPFLYPHTLRVPPPPPPCFLYCPAVFIFNPAPYEIHPL
eukprot:RCo053612